MPTMTKKLTTATASLFALAMLFGSLGCSAVKSHTYLLSQHVLSGAEKRGEDPLPPERHPPPGNIEFVRINW